MRYLNLIVSMTVSLFVKNVTVWKSFINLRTHKVNNVVIYMLTSC